MKSWLPGRRALLMTGMALFLAGCSSPPTRYYVLAPMPESAPAAGREIAVGLGPVELPDYLDRPQIVTREGQNELNLAEFDQWGEPLQDNVAQVLAENLAALLPSRKVAVYPWKRSNPVDVQVSVKVIHFERREGGEAFLSVRWSLNDGSGKELASRESRYSERASGDGYGATVAAMNRALLRFSRDLATAVRDAHGAATPL